MVFEPLVGARHLFPRHGQSRLSKGTLTRPLRAKLPPEEGAARPFQTPRREGARHQRQQRARGRVCQATPRPGRERGDRTGSGEAGRRGLSGRWSRLAEPGAPASARSAYQPDCPHPARHQRSKPQSPADTLLSRLIRSNSISSLLSLPTWWPWFESLTRLKAPARRERGEGPGTRRTYGQASGPQACAGPFCISGTDLLVL